MKILPLFLPHQGCAHQCVYCNQPLIVGPGEDRIHWEKRLETITTSPRDEWEIAFFGGTFSALDPAVMRKCLEVVAPYVKRPGVLGLRISTRPDCVSNDALAFLQSAGVRTIELGVESLDDEVLRRSARGHSAADVYDACRRIRSAGFRLGVHLMCGLPGQTEESFQQTIDEAAALQPNFVRIAPTLVLKDTPLEKLYRRGDYQPLPLEDAIRQCCCAYRAFFRRGVAIARIGLAVSDALGDGVEKIVAGPWHPALRHEVESRMARETIAALLQQEPAVDCLTIHPKDISIVWGDKRSNWIYWFEKYGRRLAMERDAAQPRYAIRVASGKLYSLFDLSLDVNS